MVMVIKMEMPPDMLKERMRGKKAVLLATSTMTVMAGATISPTLPALQSHFRAVPNIEILAPLVFQPVIVLSGLYGFLGAFGMAGNLTMALGLCFLIWSIRLTSKQG